MKVILLRDVAKIGRRNQIVEVPDGYALNQLIPKKWAEAATAQNLKKVQAATASVAAGVEKQRSFASAVEALKGVQIEVTAEANEQGHLFKAVHEKDIVAAMKEKGILLEASSIKISAPIKSVGTHEIHLVQGGAESLYTITVIKK